MSTYPAAGAVLHYDRHDRAPTDAAPLVVLSGGAGRHPSYLGDLAGLDECCPLVVPHLRGVGDSPAPVDPTHGSFWRQADDVDALRRHLGLDRLLLAGHSAGSRVAVAYAAQHPDRLAGLVLLTPTPGYLVEAESDTADKEAARMHDPVFAAAVAAMQVEVDTDQAYNRWQRDIAPASYARWGELEQAHAVAGHYYFEAAKAFFSVSPPDDLAQRLARVDAPVLVVAGAEDLMTGVAPLRAVAALFPRGRLAVVEGAGHYPWVEAPDAFRAALGGFLQLVA
jgi:pimeloyl-ACP methyl ester carboxylesterase